MLSDHQPLLPKRGDFASCAKTGRMTETYLPRFFAQAGAMLRDAGRIFIHEIHPISEMLPFDNGDPDTPDADYLRIIEPYFKAEPYEDHDSLDYVGGTDYTSAATQYWFVHTISDIIMGLVNNGFAIEHFAKYPTDISAGHQRIEAAEAGIPLSFILVGRKEMRQMKTTWAERDVDWVRPRGQ